MKQILLSLTILSISFYGTSQELKSYSVEKMDQTHVYVGSNIKDMTSPGGVRNHSNLPQKSAQKFSGTKLIVETNSIIAFNTDFQGYSVKFFNHSGETIQTRAQDSRLIIIQEAKDKKGIWRPIEFIPYAMCGNSYHNVSIEDKMFWEFTIPKYNGSMKTEMRLKFSNVSGTDIYSNTFKGSINPGQFIQSQEDIPQHMRTKKK